MGVRANAHHYFLGRLLLRWGRIFDPGKGALVALAELDGLAQDVAERYLVADEFAIALGRFLNQLFPFL